MLDPIIQFIQNIFSAIGRGIGYVDAHLLAAVCLTAGAELWTSDKRLHHVADRLGVAATPARRAGHRP